MHPGSSRKLNEVRDVAEIIGIELCELLLGRALRKNEVALAVAVGALLFEVPRKSRYGIERRELERLLICNEIDEVVIGCVLIRASGRK